MGGALNGTWGGFFGGGGAAAGLDPSLYLLRSGGTMQGPLILVGDPTVPNGAANKNYVDELRTDIAIELDMPAQFLVTGSPAAYDGKLEVAWDEIPAHYVLAGPATTGDPDAEPVFRLLTSADISDWDSTLGDTLDDLRDEIKIELDMPAQFVVTGSPADLDGKFTVTWEDVAPHYVLAGPATGTTDGPPSFRLLGADDIDAHALQTPWLSNIDANGWMLTAGSGAALSLATGPTSAPVESLRITPDTAEFKGGTPPTTIASVYTGLSTINVPYGFLALYGEHEDDPDPDILSLAQPMGSLAFSNRAIITPDQRVAQISGRIVDQQNTGQMLFFTWNKGAVAARMTITQQGYVGIGNDGKLSFGIPPTSSVHALIVGSTATPAVRGHVTTCANSATAGYILGRFEFANYAISTLDEKRVAAISGLVGSTIDSGHLAFHTWDAGVSGERMRITQTGDVGIGNNGTPPYTPNPVTLTLTVGPTSGAPGSQGHVVIASNVGTGATIGRLDFANYAIAGDAKRVAAVGAEVGNTLDSGHITFMTWNAGASVERMRISQFGNVGVGNDAATVPIAPAGFPHLIVGSTSSGGSYGFVTACGNTTTTSGVAVGVFAFANYAITAAEKRIAEVHAITDGAINSGALRFDTWRAGTRGECMRITRQGYVGVGNNGAPPFAGSGDYGHVVIGPTAAGGSSTAYGWLTLCSANDDVAGSLAYANYTIAVPEKRIAQISGRAEAGVSNSGSLIFYTWNAGFVGAPKMVVNSLGYVGIGNDSIAISRPIAPAGYMHLTVGPIPNSAYYGFITACGSTTQATGAPCGVFAFANYGITQPEKRIAEIHAVTDGNVRAGAFRFYTWTSDGNNFERIRITSTGNVGIGLATPTYQFQVNTDSAAKPGTNTWTIVSDVRTKRNIEPFEGGIETVRQLNPIVAEYNGRAHMPDGQRVVSLDPVSLREIVPAAVSSVRGKLEESDSEETDILGVNTHEIFYHLLRAVQQLDQRLAKLEGADSTADEKPFDLGDIC